MRRISRSEYNIAKFVSGFILYAISLISFVFFLTIFLIMFIIKVIVRIIKRIKGNKISLFALTTEENKVLDLMTKLFKRTNEIMNTPPKRNNIIDSNYYHDDGGNKNCVICGRRIKTGWKYCWEHRRVGKYGGDYDEWANVRENRRDKIRRNKTHRRAEGTKNLMKAFGVIRD